MSRLEANGEPSMEEILASIRKIIAEDSPASRPQPQPSPTRSLQAPSPQRGFMSRDTFIRSPSPSPVTQSERQPERSETYFSPIVPQNAPVAARGAAEVNGSGPASRLADDRASVSRPAQPPAERNVSDANSRLVPPAEAPIAAADDAAKDDADEIDAQLAELLADDLEALETNADRASGSDGPEEVAAASAVKSEPSEPRSELPSAAQKEPVAAPSDVREPSDPFAFDLGPSPFPARPPMPATPAAEKPSDNMAASLDKLERSISNIREFGSGDAASPPARPAGSLASAPAAAVAAPAAIDAAPRRDPLAVPSVAATLGPYSTLEPLSASFDRPTPPFERRPQPASFTTISPSPVADAARSTAPMIAAPSAAAQSSFPQPPFAQSSSVAQAANGRTGTTLPSTITAGSDGDRALEDTVADLLRPMLKTWLAENMPKIVERALRREINERLLGGQKNAAE